ncbi:MAG TPA: S8 family peptidase, partial [Anaerolineae bacterium]
KQNYPNCRVVNLSLGDEDRRMFGQRRQFNLAALVDELARELKLLFVISTGNLSDFDQYGFPEAYPDYLLDDTTDAAKLIDPATAALGLTVGAVTPPYGPLNRYPADLFYSPADTRHPSPFTRVGPGYQGMIKPELVEEGGNIIRDRRAATPDIGGKIITLNPNWLNEGRMFTVDHGTSLSAPKVAHLAARLFNQYPNRSPNLIKALLLASAQIPHDRPPPLSEIKLDTTDERLIDLLKVYGYGQPNFERACYSTNRSVVLLRENRIKLNGVDVYYFYLPPEFIETAGRKQLAVTLVYDPPVNKNRLDYLGCTLDFRLFKNMGVEEVVRAYGAIQTEDLADDETPEKLQTQEITLHPKSNLRKRGVHQRGIKQYSRQPRLDLDHPLVLAVVCQKRWIRDDNHRQDYAIAVTLEHQAEIDLFNRVRARIQDRARVSIR